MKGFAPFFMSLNVINTYFNIRNLVKHHEKNNIYMCFMSLGQRD